MKKINVNLYGGKGIFGGRETPLEADEIWCDKSDRCSFYKENKCLRCRSFLQPSCQFGRNNVIKGYTSRAAKYWDFKKRFSEDGVYNKLSYPNELIAVIDDMLYMNLKYTLVRKRTDKDEKWKRDIGGYLIGDKGFCTGEVFIPLKEVTNPLLFAIFSYRPRAMMGGEIKDYQEKVVPEILQQMKKVATKMYDSFISEYPQFIFEPNYIGKKAYISSLKPNTKFTYKGYEWAFDGEYVATSGFDLGIASPWWITTSNKSDVKIKVDDKMTIEINDNSIVDEDTRFK